MKKLLSTLCSLVLMTGLSFAATAPNLARIYVGTTKGIDIYNESSTGVLTLVKGSPFKAPAGLLVGVTGNNLVTMGTYLLHTYKLNATTGVPGAQESQINTATYTNDCTQPAPQTQGLASLNHKGTNVYVVFEVVPGNCAATIQSYDISSTGKLTFADSILTGDNAGSGLFQTPAIMANGVFAFAGGDFSCCGGLEPSWSVYKLRSDGAEQNYYGSNFTWDSTTYKPVGFYPMYVTTDPTNHLAAIVAQNDPNSIYGYLQGQLASYTVSSTGNLSSTSTSTNMPTPAIAVGCCVFGMQPLNMSPSGKILAVASTNTTGGGVQVFHFNGAAPITPYSRVLTSDPIGFIRWDNSNHLFAVGTTDHQIHSWYITPTQILGGQMYVIPTGTPNALVVVP